MKKPQKIEQQKSIIAPQEGEPGTNKWTRKNRGKRILLGVLCLLLIAGGGIGWGVWSSRYPDRINMGTACQMDGMKDMSMSDMEKMCQAGNAGPGTPIDTLQAPQTAPRIDTFTLTARSAHLSFGSGNSSDAWTFNGTSPGPTLHVRQGDLVVVHLVNHLSFGVTIHWHGMIVPNSADGVAGVTQDAVKPGQTYTYRFLAKEAGTYWYHSHQESFEQTGHGLYGIVVVDPITSTVHDDVDTTLALHSWNSSPTLNGTMGTVHVSAQPGQWVRLRLANTDNYPYHVTLLGASFLVAALDGHDLNGPTPLAAVPLSIDGGQRYDLRFRLPEYGPVALLLAKDGDQQYTKVPAVLVGQGQFVASVLPSLSQNEFNFATYGQPLADPITLQSHFDVTSTISLGFTIGFSNGRPGPVFTLNGKTFPDSPEIVVKPGQLIRLHFENNADSGIHPMHLHGHTFTVLTKNGQALAGSPIHLDTISVRPHESYDVAFYADNPGLWMLHCHNLYHANHGMDMMIVYPNISTPYTIGNASGNFPD
ncbi:multicopper oxidase family protein [Ktedonospora formicarum]|uniref:Copper-containing nitrite reductase n=1 Tax=Ktedonospora formicarum TaxID=2778364 RepID=A0A8J3MU45_9CHLR|nr:multicopper oxidase family protein [Ktedonospora formicarum]GHO47830.1 hypothetical protein KSX_59930 [Ktedonospora formicarum]